MNKTVIAIDIDNVVFDTTRLILQKLGFKDIDKTFEKVTDLNMTIIFGIPYDEVRATIDAAVLDPNPIIIPGAVEVLKWLQKYYDVVFITSRRNDRNIVKATYSNIFKLLETPVIIEFRELFIPQWNKSAIMNYYDVEILIEDNKDMICGALRETFADILLFDRPWNQGSEWVPEKYKNRLNRVRNWGFIKDWLIDNYGGINGTV